MYKQIVLTPFSDAPRPWAFLVNWGTRRTPTGSKLLILPGVQTRCGKASPALPAAWRRGGCVKDATHLADIREAEDAQSAVAAFARDLMRAVNSARSPREIQPDPRRQRLIAQGPSVA
jgi:hypothetical protein